MGFKIKLSRSTERLLAGGLVPDVRKEFSKNGPIKIKQAINQDMIKGISPVKGGGKWTKYSPSYKKEISKGTSSRMRAAAGGKRITPVNLRLTGQLHRSLKVSTTGGFLRAFKLVVAFNDFLADIHNKQGAGKSKVIRRLLPTESGDQFNRRINDVMFDQLKKAVATVAKKFSRQ